MTGARVVLAAADVRSVVREVIDRGLDPGLVDIETGAGLLPLVLDDAGHFSLYIRLYSRALAARNLFLSGNIDRTRWEIDAALVASAEPEAFVEEVYLAEIRDVLRSAVVALDAGEVTVEHHGPYVALTMAENLCLMRLYRRQL